MPQETTSIKWLKYSREVALACLIGSWNEKTDNDKLIVSKIVQEDYKSWISKLRAVIQDKDSPIAFKNGVWSIKDRRSFWDEIASMIFDEDLDKLKVGIVDALTERDPKFELDKSSRFSASIYGKVLTHSPSLREGLVNSLALIGTNTQKLINCSKNKAENFILESIHKVFENSDWVLWASLNQLLPTIAESSPKAFLDVVECDLQNEDTPFSELFAQEGDAITGGIYTTGLLWALETLAWEEQFIIRVSMLLGELANIDPGGKYSNRPANSLIGIFLPWFPQTLASVDKRKTAIQTLNNELPNIAWNLLLNLLPKQHQTTSGTSKPSWRKSIPENWKDEVSNKEYYEQISFYTDLLVELAKKDVKKLEQIVEHLDELPKSAFEKALINLSSKFIQDLNEDARLELWNKLLSLTNRHKKFSSAQWALPSKVVNKIKKVANLIEPKNPILYNSRLFNNRNFELYEEKGNYDVQAKKIQKRRQKAIKDVLGKNKEIENVFKLLEIVDYPSDVGWALGQFANKNYDKIILPNILIHENMKFVQFAQSYVTSKYHKHGWNWVHNLEMKNWTSTEIKQFLCCLPFNTFTWDIVKKKLGKDESEYWNNVSVYVYEKDIDFNFAIEKLVKYGRANAAIECIHRAIDENILIDSNKIIKVLISALTSKEPRNSMDAYHISEIISKLQTYEGIKEEELFRIEWAYFPFLDGTHGAHAKTIEHSLAKDPKLFCEIIQSIYISTKQPKEEKKPLSKEQESLTKRAWEVLQEWHTPPGFDKNGTFDSKHLASWLKTVKEICNESGHIKVALTWIGRVLMHSPQDKDGFWINHSVAKALNDKDSEGMRSGFYSEVINSRGVHWVDPTGAPEKALSEKYRKQAV